MYQKYLALLEKSRFDELLQVLQADLSVPMDATAAANLLTSLGEAHAMRREWAAAATAYSESINRGFADPGPILIKLIKVLLRGGFHQAVVDVCASAAGGSDEARSALLVDTARGLWGLQREAEARACIAEALDLSPTHGFARLMHGLFAPAATGGPRVVDMLARPGECAQLQAERAWEWPPAWVPAEYTRDIYPFLSGIEYEDAGFVVVAQDGAPLLRGDLCLAPGRLHGFGGPIRLRPAQGVTVSDPVATLAIDHLRALQRVIPQPIQVAELAAPDGRLTAIGRACMKHGGAPQMLVSMDVDLTRPEEELWLGVRKSYRPLIRRGEKSLSTQLIDRAHPEWDLFEHYRTLHYIHFPRPIADLVFLTIPVLRRMAEEGRMELAVAMAGDRPAAANITIDEGDASTYYSARYARDCGFDVGPFGVWTAIVRAKRRGQRRFHLGVYDHEEFSNPKMRQIAFFKAGFTDDFRYEPIWRLPAS